jgi:hypothetical protein
MEYLFHLKEYTQLDILMHIIIINSFSFWARVFFVYFWNLKFGSVEAYYYLA